MTLVEKAFKIIVENGENDGISIFSFSTMFSSPPKININFVIWLTLSQTSPGFHMSAV